MNEESFQKYQNIGVAKNWLVGLKNINLYKYK